MSKLILAKLFLILVLVGCTPSPSAAPAIAPLPHKINLPLLDIGPRPFAGVEIWPGAGVGVKSKILDLRPDLVRTYLDWGSIEAVKGIYQWPPAFDADYQMLLTTGVRILVTVKNTPVWARLDPMACGRIVPSYYPNFASFINSAITRYPGVLYWEIWNEPDLDIHYMSGLDFYFGCWGDESAPNYGGQVYGSVMRVVYPIIHTRGRIAVAGAVAFTNKNNSLSWLDGWIRDNNFDVVSMHAYMRTAAELQADINAIKSRTNKPILISETSWVCYSGSCSPAELQLQASWLRTVSQLVSVNHLLGWSWYSLPNPGWRDAGMLTLNGTPKPNYYAFKQNQGNPYP